MADYLTEVTLLSLFVALFFIWWRTQELRNVVIVHVAKACEDNGVQFLDQSVVFKKISLARNRRGVWSAKRKYCFEFSSTGTRRYKGSATLYGRKVEQIEMEPYQEE